MPRIAVRGSLLVFMCASLWSAGPATGPLRPLKNNPRYFTDGSGKAIYLAGSHNWTNFQDSGHRLPTSQDPPPQFDYTAYLDFLAAHHHNFFRLWRWEAPKWADAQPKGMMKYSRPHPWLRTGPGAAEDGKLKFDLTRYDPEYFDRMRQRITAARDRGIYVSVMLFEGWELQFTDAWTYHPFHRPNNINDVDADADGDGHGTEFNLLTSSPAGQRVFALQEAYIRKVVDTVNDLDNVLYEVCNEASAASTAWQYRVIEYVHQYESTKPRQHPIGMTFQYGGGSNALLYNSPADWVSPNAGDPDERFKENPWPARTDKVIVSDTDHLWGHTGGDNLWVWKSFMRGLNVLFMEELLPSPTWQDSARTAMGQTRDFADKMNLAEMTPSRDLSNTTYCLANKGREYLVFQSDKGEFTLNLTDAPGMFSAEWFNINTGALLPGKPVAGGAVQTFTTPFAGPAALYVKLAGSP